LAKICIAVFGIVSLPQFAYYIAIYIAANFLLMIFSIFAVKHLKLICSLSICLDCFLGVWEMLLGMNIYPQSGYWTFYFITLYILFNFLFTKFVWLHYTLLIYMFSVFTFQVIKIGETNISSILWMITFLMAVFILNMLKKETI